MATSLATPLTGTFTAAVLYRNGQPQDLGGLPGFEASRRDSDQRIRASLLVTPRSMSMAAFFGQHAWIWDNGVFTDLGTFSGAQTFAYDVNNKGQVAGVVSGGGLVNRAFLWDEQSGVMELWDNGGAGSGGLNARGDLVDGGMALLGGTQVSLLSLLGPNTEWGHLIGYDINNQGTMVGIGYRECFGVPGPCPGRAFIMFRVDEPSAVALLGLALAVFVCCRRRELRLAAQRPTMRFPNARRSRRVPDVLPRGRTSGPRGCRALAAHKQSTRASLLNDHAAL